MYPNDSKYIKILVSDGWYEYAETVTGNILRLHRFLHLCVCYASLCLKRAYTLSVLWRQHTAVSICIRGTCCASGHTRLSHKIILIVNTLHHESYYYTVQNNSNPLALLAAAWYVAPSYTSGFDSHLHQRSLQVRLAHLCLR